MLLAQQDGGSLIKIAWGPLFEDYGIPLALMGVLVVFMALALIAAFITLLPRVLRRVAPQNLPQLATLPAGSEDELSEEMVVVIAAAVAETVRQPHRVVRIRGLTPADLGWSLEGRMQQHQSHRIQHRDPR